MKNNILTFVCELKPRDLQRIKEFQVWLHRFNLVMKFVNKDKGLSQNSNLDSIELDLIELITQSTNQSFKFNAYLLKMIIVKLEFAMSEMIIESNLNHILQYEILHLNRKYFIQLFDELISPL